MFGSFSTIKTVKLTKKKIFFIYFFFLYIRIQILIYKLVYFKFVIIFVYETKVFARQKKNIYENIHTYMYI